jgi:hypothetical protein
MAGPVGTRGSERSGINASVVASQIRLAAAVGRPLVICFDSEAAGQTDADRLVERRPAVAAR